MSFEISQIEFQNIASICIDVNDPTASPNVLKFDFLDVFCDDGFKSKILISNFLGFLVY